MSCKSALYAVNSNSQTLVAGNNINLGIPVRRYGNNINISGNEVIVDGQGYYAIDANFNITGSVVGNVVITLYKDGVAIQGATANITTAVGDEYSVTIPAIIRMNCCNESVISAVISGTNATITNASIVAVKI